MYGVKSDYVELIQMGADVELMCENALIYNDPMSDVHQEAMLLYVLPLPLPIYNSSYWHQPVYVRACSRGGAVVAEELFLRAPRNRAVHRLTHLRNQGRPLVWHWCTGPPASL